MKCLKHIVAKACQAQLTGKTTITLIRKFDPHLEPANYGPRRSNKPACKRMMRFTLLELVTATPDYSRNSTNESGKRPFICPLRNKPSTGWWSA